MPLEDSTRLASCNSNLPGNRCRPCWCAPGGGAAPEAPPAPAPAAAAPPPLAAQHKEGAGVDVEVSSMRRAYIVLSAFCAGRASAEEQQLASHVCAALTQPFNAGQPLLPPSPCRALATARRRRTGCLSGAAPPPQTSRARPPGWRHRRPPQSSPPGVRCTCAGWVQGAAQCAHHAVIRAKGDAATIGSGACNSSRR